MKAKLKKLNAIISEKVVVDDITYKYKLIRFSEKSIASFRINLYEILVEMEYGAYHDYYRTGGIFSSQEKAEKFLILLKENLATPQNIPYVLEDALSF